MAGGAFSVFFVLRRHGLSLSLSSLGDATLTLKATFIITSFSLAALLCGCASRDDLGPLGNFYHDCVGSHGPRQSYVRSALRLAHRGDHAALHTVFSDHADLGTGDNEAFTELPGILLRALGYVWYTEFVVSQPAGIRLAALGLYPDQIPGFQHIYPRTATLFYQQRSPLSPASPNKALQRTAG